MDNKIYFAGDHNAGLHPKVVEEIIKANEGKDSSYREDKETLLMNENFNTLLGQKVKPLMFNTGSAANILAIAALTKPYNSIICAKCGHINTYEAGGPTRFSGCTVDTLPTKEGKITPEQILEILNKRPYENVYTQPKVVFISQPTEMGIIWTTDELSRLSSFCKSKNLHLFMDGARIAYAVQKSGVSIKEMTVDIGIDIFTWGGIKNGGLVDVLIIANPNIAPDVDFVFKQIGQDVAKTRIYSATVNALLQDNLWLKNAKIANEMATKLFDKIKNNSNIKVVLPVETNLVWAKLTEDKHKKLSQDFVYYMETNDLDLREYKDTPFFARWLTSFDTTGEEINAFAEAINKL